MDERTDEGVLWWYGHVERMGKDKIAKRVYLGECAGSHPMDRLRKKLIDTMKKWLKKKGLDVRKARRMVGLCEGE